MPERTKKSKPGRKSAWESVIRKNLEEVCERYARGATKAQIAKFLGIDITTFNRAERAHPEFADRMTAARQDLEAECRGILFTQGFVGSKTTKISKRIHGKDEVIFKEEITHPPNLNAAIYFGKLVFGWSDNPVVDEAIAGSLSNDEMRERACRMLGIPNTGDKSSAKDDEPIPPNPFTTKQYSELEGDDDE